MTLVTLELLGKGIGRAYAEIIKNANSKELNGFMKKNMDIQAHIVTVEWRG